MDQGKVQQNKDMIQHLYEVEKEEVVERKYEMKKSYRK
jgi:hypothetical protein